MSVATKPKVGDKVFILNVGNSARRVPQVLRPVTIEKVGRKYFSVKLEWIRVEFHLSDFREKTEYSPNYRLYFSEKEWEDEKEELAILSRLDTEFRYGRNPGLTLEQLRQIDAMIPKKEGK